MGTGFTVLSATLGIARSDLALGGALVAAILAFAAAVVLTLTRPSISDEDDDDLELPLAG